MDVRNYRINFSIKLSEAEKATLDRAAMVYGVRSWATLTRIVALRTARQLLQNGGLAQFGTRDPDAEYLFEDT